MKVSILQENLDKGLSVVSKIVDNRANLPILANVLIKAEEGSLKLTTTNLNIGINIWLPAKKEKEGSFTVPAKELTDFVSTLPQQKIRLEKEKESLKVSSDSYNATFNGMGAAEFPKVLSIKSQPLTRKSTARGKKSIIKKFELNVNRFLEMVEQTTFAAAQDETRPVLTGIRISTKGKNLQLVATDGYRLSLKKAKVKKSLDLPVLVVPANALSEIVRIIGGKKEGEKLTAAILKDSGQIIFKYKNIEVVARLIEGEFPDFEKIIPEESENTALLEKDEFEKAVRASSIFARKSANIIKFKFEKDEVRLRANAPEIGKNEIKLACKYSGEEMEIAFNCRFLLDFLRSYEKEKFLLEISDPLKPGVFKEEKNSNYLHIIMPVRIQQ